MSSHPPAFSPAEDGHPSDPEGHHTLQANGESPRNRRTRQEDPRTSTGGDLNKDLGTLALYLVALGSTFWSTGTRSYPLFEEWPLLVLASLTVIGTLASGLLIRAKAVPVAAGHLLRLVPAGLLIAAAVVYLLLLSFGIGVSASDPGLGNGFLLVLALGIVACLPRSGDPIAQHPRIWTRCGLVLAALAGIANLLLPFFSDDWDAASFGAATLTLNVLLVALIPAAALWSPLAALRPALSMAGLASLAWVALGAFDENSTQFAGSFGAALGLDDAVLLAGLLSLGTGIQRQSGRTFTVGASILALVTGLLTLLVTLAAFRGDWHFMETPEAMSISGGIIAMVVFLALHRGTRRAQTLPALIIAAALFTMAALASLMGFSSSWHGGLTLSLAVVLLIAIVRLDRDPGFAILPTHYRTSTDVTAIPAKAAEARAYQQSAAVLAVLSVLTGPAGILVSLSAFHRARQAEQAGLLTTAIRIIAGLGMIVGIASIFAWPLWAASLQSLWTIG